MALHAPDTMCMIFLHFQMTNLQHRFPVAFLVAALLPASDFVTSQPVIQNADPGEAQSYAVVRPKSFCLAEHTAAMVCVLTPSMIDPMYEL